MRRKITLLFFVLINFCTYIHANIDIGATAVVSPTSPMYGASNQTVTITIQNFGTDTIHFAQTNATIAVTITGASNQFFNITVNSDSLLPGNTKNIIVTGVCDLSVPGVHVFNAVATIGGDSNNGNDAMPAPVNITVMALDVGITAIIAPAATLCPSANETVTVTLSNFSASPIDFSINPVAINVNVTGASTQSFNIIVNMGTLAAGDSVHVNVTLSCNLTVPGIHIFNASATVAGDIDTSNDALNPAYNVAVNDVNAGIISAAQTICNGDTPATLAESTPASGSGILTYEWKSSDDGYTTVLGTNPTYSPSALTATTTYRRITTGTLNSVACADTSNDVTITVQAVVTGGTVAADQTICSGGDPTAFTESSAATGSGTLSYEWKSSTDGYSGVLGTSATYNAPAGLNATTTYRRIITSTVGSVGCTANSNDIIVTVNDVTAGTIATAQTICSGGDPAAFTESVAATGTGTLTYEWKSSADGYSAVLGTSATYDAPAGLTATTTFRRIAKSTVGSTECTATGNDIVVTVNDVTGGAIGSAQTICNGDDPVALTESSGASGSGTLSYAWKRSTDGYTATLGTNGASYDPPALTSTTTYRRVVTSTLNGVACAVNSNDIAITVQAVVTGGVIAANQTICSGGDPAAFTTPTAATGSGSLTYEWKRSTDGYVATASTATNYNIPSGLTATTTYRRIVTSTVGSVGCTAVSNDVVVTINDVTGGSITAPQTICSGGDPLALNESALSSGSGTLTYAWKSSADSYAATLSSNQTSYDPPAGLTATTTFRRVTTSTLGSVTCNANSNNVVITVNLVTSGTIASDQTVCYGGDPAAFTQSPAATGTGTLTYQWKSSADGYSATVSTATNYNIPSGLTATTTYRRIVTSISGSSTCSATSNDIAVTVNDPVTGGTIATAQTICSGSDPAAFTETAPSSGQGTISYQWKSSADNYSATLSTGATYDPPALTATTTFRRVTTSSFGATCTANSNDVQVTINTVTGGSVSSSQTICYGGNPAPFSQSASATGAGTLTYEWTSSGDGFSSVLSATPTYDVPAGLNSTTTYRRTVTSTLNGISCSANSNDVTVTVQAALTAGSIGSAQTVCAGGDPAAFTQTGAPTGGVGTYTYEWKNSTDGYSSNIGYNPTYNPPAGITASTTYRRITISTLGGVQCTAASNDVTVTVNNITGGTLATSQSICSGGDPTAFVEVDPAITDGGTLSYAWKSSADGYVAVLDTNTTYDPPAGLITTTSYRRTASSVFLSATCTANSNTLTIYVNEPITDNVISAAQIICDGTAADTLTGTLPNGGDGVYTYLWESSIISNNSGFSTAAGTNSNDSYYPDTLTTTTWYRRKVSSCSGNIEGTSASIQIAVNDAPIATATNNAQTICSGATFQSMVFGTSNNISGTTYTWARNKITEITGVDSSNTGNITGVVLTNTTPHPDTVTFTITPTGPAPSFCVGTPITASIVVKPKPVLSSSLTDSICSHDTVNYTPTSLTAGTTFYWERAAVIGINQAPAVDTTGISEVLTSLATFPLNVTYKYTLTADGCQNIQNLVVAVNPVPTLSSDTSLVNICSGSAFNYTPSSSSPNVIYLWSRNAVAGLSNPSNNGGGNPNEILIDTTTAPVMTAYIYHVSANGCTNPYDYTIPVRVNPKPALSSSLTPAGVCSSTPFTYTPSSGTSGATYTWARASVTGINNAAANGTGNINETLVNTTNDSVAVAYTYNLTINGCNSDSSYNVVTTIYPEPNLTSSISDTICSGGLLSYTPASSLAGTLFSWTRPAVNGISNLASSGNDTINETLVNTTSSTVKVYYIYSLSANGCSSNSPDTLTVYVLPPPVLTSTTTPLPVCSSAPFNYIPSGTPSGVAFTWTRDTIAGISNSIGMGTDTINDTLINTTAFPINVTYTYQLAANGCSDSSSYNVVVKVNPTPQLSSTTTPAALCSGGTFYYLPTSLTTGTTFSWWRDTVAGISNPASFGTNDPIETLYDTTSASVNVTYLYTLSANNCTDTQSVTVVVNPIPQLNNTLTPAAVCSGDTFSYTPASLVTGAMFTWVRDTVAGISNSPANGTDNPNEVLINTTSSTINVNYVYTVSSNGCSSSKTVTAAVKPIPQLSSSLSGNVCSGTLFHYSPASFTQSTTYTWVRATMQGVSNAAGNGSNVINEILTDTTNMPVSVTYLYTLTANSCTDTQSVLVTVNPTPKLSSTLTPVAICSGSTFSYTPTSIVPGASFTWNRNSISGIAQAESNGNNTISETLTNALNTPITVTYNYTISDTTSGCTSNQPVLVAVNPIPTFSSTLAPPALCSGNVFSYHPSSSTSNSTYTWSRAAVTGISNTASTGTDSIHETLINTATLPVTVTYIYSVSANGCTNATNYSVALTVNPAPTLNNAITVASVCSNQNFAYTPAPTVAGTTFSWSRAVVTGISNAAATGISSINETLINTTSTSATATYIYSISANGCTHTDSIAVTVNPQATGGNISSTASTVCKGANSGTLTLSGNTGTVTSWEYSTNEGVSWTTINNTTSSQTFSNIATTTIYRAVIQMGSCPVVYSGYDTITVGTSIPTGNISGNADVCSGSNTGSIVLTGYSGTIQTWLLSTNSGASWTAVPSSSSSTLGYTNITDTTWYVAVVQSGSCTDTSAIAIINAKPNPVLSFTADTACIGNTTTFTPAASVTNGTIQHYLWDFGDFTSFSSTVASSAVTHTYSDTGTYVVAFTATAESGCTTTVTNTVAVSGAPSISISITTSPATGTFGGTSLNASGGDSYTWLPAAGLSNTAIANPTASPLTTTTYTVIVTSTNGCTATDTVTVAINADELFFIPNLITPNGDGHNDTWTLKLPSVSSGVEVTIMNVEGNTVFFSTDYHNEWDGTNNKNGKLLPDGTYYYFIRFQGGDVTYKGTVAILNNL